MALGVSGIKRLQFNIIGKDQLTPVMNRAGRNAVTTSTAIKRSLGQAALAFGALALTATGAAVKMAKDYESSMQKINGLVGVSQKQVDDWSNKVLDLASTLPQSPRELADALYYVTSAGIKTSDAMGVLKASAKAAAAGLGSTETVANAVTSAVNAYGIKNLSAGKATDIMTNAVKLGKLEADSLAGVLGRVIPVTSQMGVGFDQAAAAMAAMSTTGADAEEAATSLQAILSGMLKPTTQGAKALESVGLSYKKLREEIRQKGLYAALMDVRTSFKGNDEALAAVIPNVRALRGFLSLTGAQAGNTKQIFDQMANSTGATDRAFASASKTADFKLKSALSSLQAAAIRMGAALLPIVASMADAFSKLLAPIAKNKAAFGVLATGILAFCVTTKVAMALWATSVKAALISSVVGIAIVGLSIAIAELLTHWNTVWNTMKHVTATVGNAIKDAFNAVKNFIIDKFVRPVTNGLLSFFGWIVHAAASAFGWIPGLSGKLKAAARAFDQFRDNVNKAIDRIQGKTITVGATFKVNPMATVLPKNRALGGPIDGPGTETSDSVPVWASSGEYIVRASSVRKYGRGFFDSLNAQRYASGGLVAKTKLPSMDFISSSVNSGFMAIAQKWATELSKLGVGNAGGLIALAKSFVGRVPYVWGGATPAGWDCSGMISWLYNRFGIYRGRTTAAGFQNWAVPSAGPVPGGMVFFGRPAYHIGLATGGGNMIDAKGRAYGTVFERIRGATGFGIPRKSFDVGGWLPTGVTLAVNNTGHPERVTRDDAATAVTKSGDVIVNVYGSTLATKTEIARFVADAIEYGKSHGVTMPKL